jgi:hypothetical protein
MITLPGSRLARSSNCPRTASSASPESRTLDAWAYGHGRQYRSCSPRRKSPGRSARPRRLANMRSGKKVGHQYREHREHARPQSGTAIQHKGGKTDRIEGSRDDRRKPHHPSDTEGGTDRQHAPGRQVDPTRLGERRRKSCEAQCGNGGDEPVEANASHAPDRGQQGGSGQDENASLTIEPQ